MAKDPTLVAFLGLQLRCALVDGWIVNGNNLSIYLYGMRNPYGVFRENP